MIYLVIIVAFFSSTQKDPFVAMAHAPSAAACEAKATEQRALAEKDPEVQAYSIKCVTVASKI